MYEGADKQVHALTTALDGSKRSALHSALLLGEILAAGN
jgi:hypothetical protein